MDWGILLVVICVIVIVFIIVLIPALVHRWYYRLKDKGRLGSARAVGFSFLAVSCFLLYEIVGDIWPYDSYYKDAFYNDMRVKFPEHGKIVHKTADWEDVAFAMEVDSVTYNGLREKLPGNYTFGASSIAYEIRGVTDKYNMSTVIQSHNSTKPQWAPACVYFLNDHKTIVYLSGNMVNCP